jgi:CheY-like chemotaxis protein
MQFRNMNILLVEDDLINQKIATQLLTRWGFSVRVANDGKEALDLIREKSFRLVLMDLNMPVMDGAEATRTIRAFEDPYFQSLPILAYTASTLADTKEKALKIGMNDCVAKPLAPEEMHCKINHYILFPSLDPRPLRIKFDLYADSEPDFKSELVELMISNVTELQYACYRTFYTGELKLFQTVAHKIKSTLILLDDREFAYVIDDLKQAFQAENSPNVIQEKINRFNYMSESILKTLTREIADLKEAC